MIKFVISDYNWINSDISKAWFNEFTSNYLVLDKYHRLEKSEKVIWQKNVGQNVYDMFDYIVNNYNDLPKKIFFCRSCINFPQGRPKPLSNGNCSLEEIRRLINKEGLVEVNDYYNLKKFKALNKKFKYIENEDKFKIHNSSELSFYEHTKFYLKKYPTSYCNKKDGYLEINNNWYTKYHQPKFFQSFNNLMSFYFENYTPLRYIRFSPGCNYLIPSELIYKYPKDFYLKLRSLVDYAPVVGEAHLLERALYLIFKGKYNLK